MLQKLFDWFTGKNDFRFPPSYMLPGFIAHEFQYGFEKGYSEGYRKGFEDATKLWTK